MKIGMLSKFMPEKDGIAIYSQDLCSELSRICRVIRIGDINSKSADYRLDFKSFFLKSRLQRIIENEKIDVLHIQWIASYFGRYTLNLNLLKTLSQDIPVVCTMHEVHQGNERYGFLRKKVLMFLQKEIIRKSGAIIVHSPKQRRFILKRYANGKTDSQVECVYHGVNLIPKKREKRSEILFFGIISKNKGLELLVKAMKLLPELRLRIVGSFYDRNYEKHVRKMLENSANVTFRFEWVSEKEKWRYFKKADVCVLPYVHAPYQSGVLHNSVSVGIPVVVTKTGSIHDLVEYYKFGELVERNPEAVAEGIRKIMKNYARYSKGLAAYRKEANWKAVAKKHLDIYQRLAAGKKARQQRNSDAIS